jgi:hypothetical protein
MGENLDDFGFGNDFFETRPKIRSMEVKTHKLDFIK